MSELEANAHQEPAPQVDTRNHDVVFDVHAQLNSEGGVPHGTVPSGIDVLEAARRVVDEAASTVAEEARLQRATQRVKDSGIFDKRNRENGDE